MTTYNVVSPGNLIAGQPEDISVVLANFQAIATVLNGGIDNGNIAAGAAISPSKFSGYPASSVVFLRGDGAWTNPGLASATGGLNISGANTDLTWAGGAASVVYAQGTTGGGSLRSLGAPTFGVGTRYILRNSSGGNITILHATGGGSGQQLYTRSLGSIVLAPNENAEFIFDGSLWVEVGRNQASAAAITYAAVRMSAAQNHNSGGSYSVMAFDAEDLDTSNFHDNVTNPGRLTVPTTGIYRLFGTAQFTGQVNLMGIKFRKNGATDLYGVETVGGAGKQGISHTDIVSLNAGDYVEALALQSNGVQAYAVGSSGAVCRFGIHLVT
jgi:hypothetical protein